ncbi:hypothetical protein [Methanothermobacter marburgensis]|uniref:hypothetical protein n=1 Tax=Methanothermobacter marburgensis TaxID=145263 RepID=UPI0035B974B4
MREDPYPQKNPFLRNPPKLKNLIQKNPFLRNPPKLKNLIQKKLKRFLFRTSLNR